MIRLLFINGKLCGRNGATLTKKHCYHGITNAFRSAFLSKVYCEACCGGTKKWDVMFLYQSLLLNTIVLNDKGTLIYYIRSLNSHDLVLRHMISALITW